MGVFPVQLFLRPCLTAANHCTIDIMLRSTRFLSLALLLAQFAVASCNRTPANSNAPAAPNAVPAQVRIVSLSPAISRTLIDFDLQSKIVGRTPHCDALDQSIPVVGDLLNINYEQIIRLNPTHVLVQPPEAGVDPHLQALANEHHWTIASWRLVSVDDIETMVREIPGALFPDGSEQFAEASRRAADIQSHMASALSPGAAPVFHGRTMLIYSLAPISVFGDGTYLDNVLKSLGGANAVTDKNWIALSLEDVVRLNPEAIILVKPHGESINLGIRGAMGQIWDLEIDAVFQRRLAVLSHPDAFMPCSGVIGVADELREILERFEASGP